VNCVKTAEKTKLFFGTEAILSRGHTGLMSDCVSIFQIPVLFTV